MEVYKPVSEQDTYEQEQARQLVVMTQALGNLGMNKVITPPTVFTPYN